MAPRKFSAEVQWWDSSDVYVQCPFCSKIHRHDFQQSYDSVHRSSHCDTGAKPRSYSFKYPFSENPESTAYEIDKVSQRYVALGASPPQPKEDMLVGAFAGMILDQTLTTTLPSWEDATETVTIDDNDLYFRRLRRGVGGDPTLELKRIEHVSSKMILFGNLNYVREYLDTSPEKHLFIHGVDSEGKTSLLLAACEKYPAIVKLLLERGADPNRQTKKGRTPLMEAALWGRYENVEHLLENNADKDLIDNNGLKAIDFATPSDRNEEERYRRSGEKHPVYREVTYTANQARRMIVSILKDDAGDQPPPAANTILENRFIFQKSEGKITLYAPIAEYPIFTPCRYPFIAAMSGWTHGKTTTLVSGRDWTSEVIRIAKIIGHTLAPDDWDNNIPGKYHACHAEKQLIAYFISKHVFLEPEIRAFKNPFGYPDTYDSGDDEPEEGGTLHELAAIAPPASLKQASILVSNPPCGDCLRFIKVVNAKLNLRISVRNTCVQD